MKELDLLNLESGKNTKKNANNTGNSFNKIYEDFILKLPNKVIFDGNNYYVYNGSFYKLYTLLEFKKIIKQFIEVNYPYSLKSYLINDIIKLLEIDLYVNPNSFNKRDYLNFLDGVLNLNTKELEPHDPKNIFTYVQPVSFNQKKEPVEILKFINACVSNDTDEADKLLAFCYCILTNITRFEMFLEIVGSGSSGKSTFVNLLRALINPSQAAASTLRQIESGKFESMNLKGKKLIYVADSESYKGNLGLLKSYVSGDSVRAEVKFGDIYNIELKAIFVFCGNYNITSQDYSSGIIRRRVLIFFNNISTSRQKLIEINEDIYTGILSEELSGFIQYLLDNSEYYINKMKNISDKMSQNQNPLYNFLYEYFIFENSRNKIYVGNNLKDFSKDSLYIYPLYTLFCKAHNIKIESLNKFVEVMNDFIRVNSLQVTKKKDNKGSYYTGIDFNWENIDNLLN